MPKDHAGAKVIPPRCKRGLQAVRLEIDTLSLKLTVCESAAQSAEEFGNFTPFWQALAVFCRASADLHQTVNKLVQAAKH